MQTGDALKLAALAALAVLGVVIVTRAARMGQTAFNAAGDALWAVSPTNSENVIYQTANKPIQWLTGDPTATIGGTVYDVTHDGTLNPASSNNFIYRNITPGGQSLGAWLYDKLN